MFKTAVWRIAVLAAAIACWLSAPNCSAQEWLSLKSDAELKAEAAIHEALEKEISLEFKETPLTEVAHALRAKLGVNCLLDKKALEDAGVGLDTPVTFKFSAIRAKSACRLMFERMELSCVVSDEVLMITTPEKARAELEVRIYPVRDLVDVPGGDGTKSDADSLIKAMLGSIAPPPWDDGDESSISYLPSAGALVVLQTNDQQEQFTTLLAKLRTVRDMQPAGQGGARVDASGARPNPSAANGEKKPRKLADSLTLQDAAAEEAEAKIEAALEKPITLDFTEAPLSDVIDAFAEKLGINCVLDARALGDGTGPDSPITYKVSGITARTALKHVVEISELTSVIKDDVLIVTRRELADNELEVRIYSIGDLVKAQEQDGSRENAAGLVDIIKSSIRPTSWDNHPIHASAKYHPNSGALVVSQTRDAQKQIAALLSKLRKARELQKHKAIGATNPKRAAADNSGGPATQAPRN